MTETVAGLVARLNETRDYLLSKCPRFPRIVVVLGSGLSGVLDGMRKEVEIPFHEIPHVKRATVEGHRGRLVIGELGGVRVACMQGRLHYFEGLTMDEVVFPHRALAWAGAEVFVLTNSSGGLHGDMQPLELMLVTDHINLMGANPLTGPNERELGVRFPDMTYLYDRALSDAFRQSAKRLGLALREGVYIGVHGPSYETPAEIRMLRGLGGDAVGMSTIPEAIAVHHMGRRVVAVSCITNPAAGVVDAPLVHDDVLENAKKAYGRFSSLILESLKAIEAEHAGKSGH